MDLSLNALVEQLDDFFFERASHDFRSAAGLATEATPPRVPEELARTDAFLYIGELLSSPRTDEGKRARLTLLYRYAARTFVEGAASDAQAALDERLHGTPLVSNGRRTRLDEALRELPRLSAREARATLERDLLAHLSGAERAWCSWVDALLAGVSELRLDLGALVELEQHRAVAPRAEAARRLLDDTQDAAADLAAYALKRVDPALTLKTASAHDLTRAALAPWLFESFRREDLQHAVSRCLSDLGLDPSAGGRITVDSELRPGRRVGAHVFELRVPDQLRLVLTPDAGFDSYASWLGAWGTALHRAHVNRALPFVERRLGDAALPSSVGQLFESFLLEEGWLKRYLRLTAPVAREAARLFAFRQLMELRRQAALAIAATRLAVAGPTPPFFEEAQSLLQHATLADVPRGTLMLDVDPLGGSLRSLDAAALETVFHGHLRERFNEDYYRNPATGRWLVELASKGQRDDAVVVASAVVGLKEPSPAALDLAVAARRRLEHMDA